MSRGSRPIRLRAKSLSAPTSAFEYGYVSPVPTIPLSVCSRTHQNSAPSDPPPPPPTCRSLRNVTASICRIFIGSVFSTAARISAVSRLPAASPRKSRRLNSHRILFDILVHLRFPALPLVDIPEPLRVLQLVRLA